MRFLLLCSVLLACGSTQKVDAAQSDVKLLEGNYMSESNESKAIPKDKPVVVAFAGSFCGPCNEEGQEWSDYLQGKDPTSVKILTISVSDNQSMLGKWKKRLKAGWEFGIDNENLFDKYCNGYIPCVLVSKNGEILFSHTGVTPIKTLEGYSGKWE